jgi:antitoxin YefM
MPFAYLLGERAHKVMTTSYSEARANFAHYWDRAVNDREIVRVKRRGRGDIMIIAADELEGLLETAYLLRSPRNAERLNVALREAREHPPEPMTVDDLRRELGLSDEAQSD